VALDEELQRFEAFDGHAVSSSHESQEVLLLLEVEFVQQLPKISE
jgi:DNA-directed RNA polymerase subunit H (RpoH/RPB5)